MNESTTLGRRWTASCLVHTRFRVVTDTGGSTEMSDREKNKAQTRPRGKPPGTSFDCFSRRAKRPSSRETLRLEDVRADPDLQMRAALNEETVNAYIERYKSRDALGPV